MIGHTANECWEMITWPFLLTCTVRCCMHLCTECAHLLTVRYFVRYYQYLNTHLCCAALQLKCAGACCPASCFGKICDRPRFLQTKSGTRWHEGRFWPFRRKKEWKKLRRSLLALLVTERMRPPFFIFTLAILCLSPRIQVGRHG